MEAKRLMWQEIIVTEPVQTKLLIIRWTAGALFERNKHKYINLDNKTMIVEFNIPYWQPFSSKSFMIFPPSLKRNKAMLDNVKLLWLN